MRLYADGSGFLYPFLGSEDKPICAGRGLLSFSVKLAVFVQSLAVAGEPPVGCLRKGIWFFKIRFYICGVIEGPWGEI